MAFWGRFLRNLVFFGRFFRTFVGFVNWLVTLGRLDIGSAVIGGTTERRVRVEVFEGKAFVWKAFRNPKPAMPWPCSLAAL